MTPVGVLVVARDAGAASALAPVVSALLDEGTMSPEIVAWGNAAATFAEEGLAVRQFPEDSEPGEIDELVRAVGARVVLSGTSLRVELDRLFWSVAGVPSVALLDHWKNYAERFSIESPFDTLPTVVAVMDGVAEHELVARGCPPGRIRVTGQPRFDTLPATALPELRARARAQLGVEASRPVVVFASEPRGAPYDDGRGFTRAEAIAAFLDGVAATAPGALVLVKLHPVEQSGPVASPDSPLDVRVLRDFPVRELIAAADVFCGMTSIALLDAALLGVPTISIRPGGGESHFVDLHAELIATAATPEEMRAALEEALARELRRPSSSVGHGATARVCALLSEVADEDGIMPA